MVYESIPQPHGGRGRCAAAHHGLLGGEAWVLTLPVTSQVDLPLERLVAEAAREGLVPRVLAHVCDQVGGLAEGFPAHDTLMRLFACNKIVFFTFIFDDINFMLNKLKCL